jgi:hypothetical protein
MNFVLTFSEGLANVFTAIDDKGDCTSQLCKNPAVKISARHGQNIFSTQTWSKRR